MIPIGEECDTTGTLTEKESTRGTWLGSRASRTLGGIRETWPAFALALLLVASWEVLSARGVLRSYIAPAPSKLVEVLFSMLPTVAKHAWVTIQEVLLGYAFGFVFGIPIGIAISYSRLMERALYPLVVISQTIPIIALAPILVSWFGFGIWPKLVIVALITFFPLTVSTIDGLRSVEPELLRFLRSLGATERQLFFKIKVPSALPYLFTGIKVSVAYAVIAAVIGEWVGGHDGLGAVMQRAQNMYYNDVVFTMVAVIALLGYLAVQVALIGERIVIPWHLAKRERT